MAVKTKRKRPHYLWDYDVEELEKTEKGRIFILERMINYGPGEEKIKLADVKKHWDKLDLYYPQRHLLELMIWGKPISSRPNKQQFSLK
ncbi:MAG TPA: hypothetical protein VNA13_00860 [Xanthomonadales bacterium]|nr:hypothetical protein [Xanthomonadales bacterium]